MRTPAWVHTMGVGVCRALSPAVNIWVPIKTLTYLSSYFGNIRKLHHPPIDPYTVHLFRAMFVMLAYNFVHLTFLGLWPGLSLDQRMLHCDVFYALLPKQIYELNTALGTVQTAVNLRVLYYRFDPAVNNLLEDVLLRGRVDFFLTTKHRGKSIRRQLQTAFLRTVNVFNTFTTFLNLLFIYIHVTFSVAIYRRYGSDPYLPLLLLFHLFNTVCFWSYLHAIFQTCTTVGVCCALYLRIISVKLSQLYSALVADVHLTRFAYIRAQYVPTLCAFFAGNRVYGGLFLAYLVVHCPSNVVLLMNTILGNVSSSSMVFVVAIIAHEITSTLLVHLYLTVISKRIHQSGRAMLSLTVRSQHMIGRVPFHSRMQVCHFIHHFHTNHRYGFTYGSFGLVSLRAFTAYILLYVKFLLICYKLIKQSLI